MSKITAKKTGTPAGKATTKKVTDGRQSVVAAESQQPTSAPLKASAPAAVIKVVKAEEKYTGARAAWYAALQAHNGKDADAFVADCTKTPPTTPKSGKAEDPRGWLRFFVREGVASLS